jgi:hypothetical protein
MINIIGNVEDLLGIAHHESLDGKRRFQPRPVQLGDEHAGFQIHGGEFYQSHSTPLKRFPVITG